MTTLSTLPIRLPRDYRKAQGGLYEHSSAAGFRTPLRVSSPYGGGDLEFRPGEVRSVGSRFPDRLAGEQGMSMQTNAVGSVLHIGGGIAVRSQLFGGRWSDADPVPLEAIRGATRVPVGFDFSVDIDTQEPISNWDNPNWQMPLLPAEVAGGTATLYDRVIKSVIPVSLTSPFLLTETAA